MGVSHLFYTYSRSAQELKGDIIEGRDVPGGEPFSVREHNEWGVIEVSDIDRGDMATDPNGWWSWWEENHLDEVKVDAFIAKLSKKERKDRALFTKERRRKGHPKYKTKIERTDIATMTWAEIKSLCSKRTTTREDLRPEYWDQMAQQPAP